MLIFLKCFQLHVFMHRLAIKVIMLSSVVGSLPAGWERIEMGKKKKWYHLKS